MFRPKGMIYNPVKNFPFSFGRKYSTRFDSAVTNTLDKHMGVTYSHQAKKKFQA